MGRRPPASVDRFRIRLLAALSVAGVASFAAAVATMHVRAARTFWYLSEFATGPDGWMWLLGLALLVVSGACLARAIVLGLPACASRRRTVALLAGAGLALTLVGVLPVDADPHQLTVTGAGHNVAATGLFILLAAAMLCAADGLAAMPAGRVLWRASRIGAAVVAAGTVWLLAAQAAGDATVMVAQRTVVVAILGWMLMVAGSIWRAPGRGRKAPSRAHTTSARRHVAG